MSGTASNNKWKQYGGTQKKERFQNMEVGIITADKFIVRNQNSLYTYFESIKVNGDADIYQNLRVLEGNSYFQNQAFFGTTDISNSALFSFLKGDSQRARYEFSTPDTSGLGLDAMLSVNGDVENTNIATFQTTGPQIRNILTRQGRNSGSVAYSDSSSSLLGFYTTNDTSYISVDVSLSHAVSKIGIEKGNTIIAANGSLLMSAERTILHNKDATDAAISSVSSLASSASSIVTILDKNNGPLLYDAYLSPNISLGNALSLQSVDNESSTSMRLTNPAGNGIIMTGGTLPIVTDTARGMGIIGTIDASNNIIPSQVLVAGNDPTKIRNTLGINTFSPKTGRYSMDINGPIHLGNGELNTLFYTPEMSNNTIRRAKNDRHFIINSGHMNSPTSNIYISKDGGKSWATRNLDPFFGNSAFNQALDFYIDSSSTFFIYTTNNNSILYTIDGGNTIYKIIDATASIGDTYKTLYYDNSGRCLYIAVKNSVDVFRYQYCVIGDISIGRDIIDIPFIDVATANPIVDKIVACDGSGGHIYFVSEGIQRLDINGLNMPPTVNTIYNGSGHLYNAVDIYNDIVVAVGNSIISISVGLGVDNWHYIVPNILGLASFKLYGVNVFDTSNAIAVGEDNQGYGLIIYTKDLYNGNSIWSNVPSDILNSSGIGSLVIRDSQLRGICMPNLDSFVLSDIANNKVLYGYYPNLLNHLNNVVMDVSGIINVDGFVNCNNFISKSVVITDMNVKGNTFFKNMIVENITAIGRPNFSEYKFDHTTFSFINQYGNTTTEPVGGYIVEFPTNYVPGDYIDQLSIKTFFFTLEVSGGINVSDNYYRDGKKMTTWLSDNGNDIFWDEGKVGLGLSVPTQTLDVSGSALFRGDVSMNGRMDYMGANYGFDASYVNSYNNNIYYGGSTQVATTQYVGKALAYLIGSAPETLDTIQEIATSLSGQVDAFVSLTNSIKTKLDISGGIVTGDLSLNSRLDVSGSVLFRSDVSANGRISVASDSSFNKRLDVLGASLFRSDVSANGRISVASDSSFNGRLDVLGSALFRSDVSANGRISVANDSSFNGRLDVLGTSLFRSDVSANGRISVANDSSFNGRLYVSGSVLFRSDVSANGRISVASDSSFNGNIGLNKNMAIIWDGTDSIKKSASDQLTISSLNGVYFRSNNNSTMSVMGNIVNINDTLNIAPIMDNSTPLSSQQLIVGNSFGSRIWFSTNLSSGSYSNLTQDNDCGIFFSKNTTLGGDGKNSGALVIGPHGSGGIRITESGDVGINVFNPVARLDVNGNVFIKDKLTLYSSIFSDRTDGFNIFPIKGDERTFFMYYYNTTSPQDENTDRRYSFYFANTNDNGSVGVLEIYYNKNANTGIVAIGNGTTSSSLNVNGSINVGINSIYTNISSTSGILKINTAITIDGQCEATSFNVSSDYRIKTNVTGIQENRSIDILRPVQYFNTLSNKVDIGFIAHEVQEHFPELVNGSKDDIDKEGKPIYQSINYTGLIPILTKEIQDLKAIIKNLDKKHTEDIDTIRTILNRVMVISILYIISSVVVVVTFL